MAYKSREMAQCFGFQGLVEEHALRGEQRELRMSMPMRWAFPALQPEIGGQCTRMYQRDEHKQIFGDRNSQCDDPAGDSEGSVPANEGVHHS